jgi:hypothetical protein
VVTLKVLSAAVLRFADKRHDAAESERSGFQHRASTYAAEHVLRAADRIEGGLAACTLHSALNRRYHFMLLIQVMPD